MTLFVLSVFTAIFMSACGEDDKGSKSNGSNDYVEINDVCFDKDREREVSLRRCDDARAPRYEISGNDCYRIRNGRRDERVSDRICDLYYDADFTSNSNRNCNGILYHWSGWNYEQVDCGFYDCRGYTLYRDRNGRDEVRCN